MNNMYMTKKVLLVALVIASSLVFFKLTAYAIPTDVVLYKFGAE